MLWVIPWHILSTTFANSFTYSCALKWNTPSPLGKELVCFMLIFSERIFFISFLIVTEFLGLESFVVILSTIRIKSAIFRAAEAIQLLVLPFGVGYLTSDKAFAEGDFKWLEGDFNWLEGDFNSISFLSKILCIQKHVNISYNVCWNLSGWSIFFNKDFMGYPRKISIL